MPNDAKQPTAEGKPDEKPKSLNRRRMCMNATLCTPCAASLQASCVSRPKERSSRGGAYDDSRRLTSPGAFLGSCGNQQGRGCQAVRESQTCFGELSTRARRRVVEVSPSMAIQTSTDPGAPNVRVPQQPAQCRDRLHCFSSQTTT